MTFANMLNDALLKDMEGEHVGYHQFVNDEGEKYGSFEVFYHAEMGVGDHEAFEGGTGWYWWACFPGCLPDGDPSGPFKTPKEAFDDARAL